MINSLHSIQNISIGLWKPIVAADLLKVVWFSSDHGCHIQECHVLFDTTTGFSINLMAVSTIALES